MDSVASELKQNSTQSFEKMSLLTKYCMILANKDKVFIPAKSTQELLGEFTDNALCDFSMFQDSWNNLKLDEYMADNGKYRRRRYATYQTDYGNDSFRVVPHQPHYQSVDYNPLNGGIARHFITYKSKSR